MKSAIRFAAQTSYTVTAALMLVLGTSVLLAGAGLLPGLLSELMEEAQGSLATLHIMQEFAALLVLVGLITVWFIRHYGQSLPFHWAMTLFFALLALVHWFDIRGPSPSIAGPLVTTIPFFAFAAIGVLRVKTERDAGRS